MPNSAILLMDIQKDFLDCEGGRMPVDRRGAEAVIQAANEVLSKSVLAEALPVLIVNEFPPSARLANCFRRGAAVAGSPGAALDSRLLRTGSERVFAKSKPSAFSNPELMKFLHDQGVQELHVLGVLAEGCVRATVLDAIRLGFAVCVIENAIATNARWKKRFALWSMKRAGATVQPIMRATSSNPCCSGLPWAASDLKR
jgi:nicotinamidase-related amidase